ncbi:MAG: hypothetical protein PHZ26_04245 [Candidatus Gracilibacteria bacterium]|nr:hypothetical protein [Candidatus Gracilibacteria bacterium]MDD2908938.1 hypothetical protein [Candidatus Gracilibacteria bacterium]
MNDNQGNEKIIPLNVLDGIKNDLKPFLNGGQNLFVQSSTNNRVNEQLKKYHVSGPSGKVIRVTELGETEYFFNQEEDLEGVINFSFPTYIFGTDDGENTNKSRRKQYQTIKKHIFKLLEDMFISLKRNKSYLTTFMVILAEMMKNSMDHSTNEAYLGIHIRLVRDKIILHFALADNGNGIIGNSSMPSMDKIYQDICTIGVSSKTGNGINCGVGMNLLSEGLVNLNVSISAFDNSYEYKFKETDDLDGRLNKNIFQINKNIKFYYLGTAVFS